jgi:hypothetical protein
MEFGKTLVLEDVIPEIIFRLIFLEVLGMDATKAIF